MGATSIAESPLLSFKHINVKELHPTIGAEVSGIDFSAPMTDEVFSEVHAAITRASHNQNFLPHRIEKKSDLHSMGCSSLEKRPSTIKGILTLAGISEN